VDITPAQKIEIQSIAGKYPVFECIACAKEIRDFLETNGIPGKDWLANFDSPVLDAGESFLIQEVPF